MRVLLVVYVALFVTKNASSNLARKDLGLKPLLRNAAGARRGAVMAQVGAAGAEKAKEVLSEAVDNQLKIIDEQQKRAENFLKQKISLDIKPGMGWKNDDMFAPPGVHYGIGLSSDDDDKSGDSEKVDQPPYTYANGFVGPALMNGCFGSGYKPGDPCYTAKETTKQCRDMIDGAAFIGVGFDGKGEFSPESRKMSIIQRSCGGHSYYDDDQVPDTMNVHGIYDTSAHMYTFSSRSEYQSYLQKEAGVSGSFFGFYAGVKKAWGSSTSSNTQQYLSVFDIDVTRYEIFKDEVKPADLSQAFLHEFLHLPESYFHPGAARAFQDFILRWGTHYVKSAKFGGQLEFRKTLQGTSIASKQAASVVMEAEYKGLFMSAGAKYSSKEGEDKKSEHKYSASSIAVKGGSQEIAAILSDEGTPAFKNELKAWLASIPKYPKAYKFRLGSITELVNFRAGELFPEEYTEGCDKAFLSMEGEKVFYEKDGKNGKEKIYCDFKSRKELEEKLRRKRKSLERAIDVYMDEGPSLTSDITVGPGPPACELGLGGPTEVKTHPTWTQLTDGTTIAELEFDMREPLYGNHAPIAKDAKRLIKFRNNKWYTSDETGRFVLYNAYPSPTSNTENKNVINVLGMELVYNQNTGLLKKEDKDSPIAMLRWPRKGKQSDETAGDFADDTKKKKDAVTRKEDPLWPCNVQWLNENMIKRTPQGSCIHFSASSEGPIYVVFSLNPSNKNTWYHVRIGPKDVIIFKEGVAKTGTTHKNALGLGDAALFQSYFVCLKEGEGSTVIEYGKSYGSTDRGDVYLSLVDTDYPVEVAFYAFGNGERMLHVSNVNVVEKRALLQAKCKGITHKDPEGKSPFCISKSCHLLCDPIMGCTESNKPSKCGRCRHAKKGDTCVSTCDAGQAPSGTERECVVLYDLVFPTKGTTDYVSVSIKQGVFEDVTVSYWIKKTSSRSESVISYAVSQTSGSLATNEMILGSFEGDNYHVFSVKGDAYKDFTAREKMQNALSVGKWHHFTFTWQGKTGEWKIYVDYKDIMKDINTRTFKSGQKLNGGGKFVIAQEQDSFGGGFDESQAFVGSISAVNMWDRILTLAEITEHASSCAPPEGNLVSWNKVLERVVEMKKSSLKKTSTCKAV